MAKTHPHIEMPSESDLARLIEDWPWELQRLYLEAHKLVVEAVPDIRYSVDSVDRAIGYGARQYGYDGWGMAAITPYSKWVSVTFLRGALLADPEGLLEGATQLRHVKLKSVEQFEASRDGIRRLIEGAVGASG